MKVILVFFLLYPLILISQSISINSDGSLPNASAILDINSTDKGFLIPRTDTSNIASPSQGLMIFQLSDNAFYFHNGSRWQNLSKEANFPIGTILLTDTFPNQNLEESGFRIYGSYEETFENLIADSINYGVWTNIGSNVPASLVGDKGYWTGSELLIWGGGNSQRSNIGAKYNPDSDSWTPTSMLNAPSARRDFASVWTGSKLLVFGGNSELGDVNDMYQYDPSSDTWATITSTNTPSPRITSQALWKGDSLIIWGTKIGSTFISDGFIYDANMNSWSAMNNTDGPVEGSMAYGGGKLFVFGGAQYNGYPTCAYVNTPNKYYDLSNNTWVTYANVARRSANAFAINNSVYLFGGSRLRFTPQSGGPFGSDSCNPTTSLRFGLYGKYDLDSAKIISAVNDLQLQNPVGGGKLTFMCYTGQEIVYWGSAFQGGTVGMKINPITNDNTPMTTVNVPPGGNYFAVWADDQMLIFSEQQGLFSYDPSAKGIKPVENITKTIYMYKKGI